MRQGVVILAVLVSAAALAVSAAAFYVKDTDEAETTSVKSQVNSMRSQLGGVDEKLAKADDSIAALKVRVDELDEVSKGLVAVSAKTPGERDLRREVDLVVKTKLKDAIWPTSEKKLEAKSGKDRQFYSMYKAVVKGAKLGPKRADGMLSMLTVQRDKLNSIFKDAKVKKITSQERDRRLSTAKKQLDGTFRWYMTAKQYSDYSRWRNSVSDRYTKMFLVP